MTAPWLDNLAAYSVQVLALVAISGALAAAFRLRSARALLWYWRAVLAGVLLLPAIQPWEHPVVRISAFAQDVSFAPAAGETTVVASRFSLEGAIGLVLLAGLAARLAWLAAGALRLRTYCRRAAPFEPLPGDLAFRAGGLPVRARILLTRELETPVTFGLLRPVVLLPERFGQMPAGLRQAVVCHELVHVERRDWAYIVGEELVRALLWFHPAVWWVLARIQLAREQVVDRETIARTGDRRLYLDALLEAASARRRLLVAAFAPLFLRRRHFKQRVALIVKEVPMSLPRLVLTLVLIAVVLVPATAIAVRAFPLEGSAVPAAPDQIKVGGKVMQKKLVHKVAPVYPPLAKQAQIQGTVRLQAVVAPDGSIKDLQVISGHPLLIPPSEEAVRQWRYEPTLLNGNPVEVVTQIDINYTLSETKEGIPVILGGQQPAAPPLDFLIPNPTFQTQPAPGVQRLRVSGNVQQQKLEHTAPAVWPPPAQQAQVKGVARFNALIGTDGMVKEIQIVSGHPLLIPAAREALEQYRYQPTLLNGQPVEVVAQVNIPVPPDYEAPAAELLGFKPSGDITPPMLVRKVEPQYTQEAKDAKLEGTLLAAVTVDEQGKVSDVLIVRGLGLGLDEKAVEALRQWEFQPGQKDGQPVKIRATVEINFRLM